MKKLLHDLQLPVLVPLVLVHLFDGHFFVVFIDSGLKNDAKRPISNHPLGIVGETQRLVLFVLHF